MQALVITAHLRNGFVSSDPWSPSIDAILGYWQLREEMGEEAFTLAASSLGTLQPVENLPLAKTHYLSDLGAEPLWWFQCSSPVFQQAAESLRHYHRRFDALQAEHYMLPQKGRMEVSAGPYKNFRNSYLLHVTPAVRWYAVGDKCEVQHLLNRCTHIGALTGAGNGAVARWEVVESADPETVTMARLHRPLPETYATQNEVTGSRMIWGYRPPGRLVGNQTLCIMPTASPVKQR